MLPQEERDKYIQGARDLSEEQKLLAISVILGEAWWMLPQEERDKYIQGARDLSEEQKLLYPDCWKRKRSHSTSYRSLSFTVAISVILGEAWRMLPQEERDKYIQGARDLSEEQKLLYPDCWKRKRSHSTS
ncbi:HMG box-containing protein 1 [Homalodisca vitripennis]|nr:HMG box-containing protein 1 [Homalodisca vitripennis]